MKETFVHDESHIFVFQKTSDWHTVVKTAQHIFEHLGGLRFVYFSWPVDEPIKADKKERVLKSADVIHKGFEFMRTKRLAGISTGNRSSGSRCSSTIPIAPSSTSARA